jgi:protein-disulfide isomerase
MVRPVRPEEGDSMNAFECRTSRAATLGGAMPEIPQNPNEWRRWGAAALVSLIIAAAPGIPAARAEATTTDALAEVNGETITAKELETRLGAKISQLEEQIYALKRAELDALIAQHLLAQEAAKRGIPVAALMDAEVTSKVSLVTEKEIDEYYNSNKARLRGDEAAVRPRIRQQLQQQKLNARQDVFLTSLRSDAKIVDRLEPPLAARVDVAVAGAPVRGAPDARVTVVEFSDFECPFCKRANGTMASLLEKYSGKIRLVYRDFPLENIHPLARRAAEAARCARDGGKFWEYHDVLFAQSPKLAPEDLQRYAVQVGLDAKKFDACLASGAQSAGVQSDIDEGQRLGITATPVFFINGRSVRGAQPAETFARVIDDELARTSRVAAKSQ